MHDENIKQKTQQIMAVLIETLSDLGLTHIEIARILIAYSSRIFDLKKGLPNETGPDVEKLEKVVQILQS